MKKLIALLLGLFGAGFVSAQNNTAKADLQFIFVKIPEQIEPIDRGKKYEDPIDAILKNAKVGEVLGGGTQLSHPDKDGKRSIAWVGVDVDLSDFSRGIPLLKNALIKCGAPAGTVMEYTRNGVKHSVPCSRLSSS